jgi:hypothetical protein
MDLLHRMYAIFYDQIGGSIYYVIGFAVLLSIVAQWKLYEKAGQPGVASVVPFWNAIVFLRIVGRPAKHLWLFLIPVYGQLYMIPKVWIEMCQSFGKRSTLDYVLVILLNGLYIFNLGMSYDTRYTGPVYGRPLPPLRRRRPMKPHPSIA